MYFRSLTKKNLRKWISRSKDTWIWSWESPKIWVRNGDTGFMVNAMVFSIGICTIKQGKYHEIPCSHAHHSWGRDCGEIADFKSTYLHFQKSIFVDFLCEWPPIHRLRVLQVSFPDSIAFFTEVPYSALFYLYFLFSLRILEPARRFLTKSHTQRIPARHAPLVHASL